MELSAAVLLLVLVFLLPGLLYLLRRPLKLVLRYGGRSLLGFASLLLLQLAAPVTGISLGVNLFNALFIGFLGLPGLGLLALLGKIGV